VPETVLRPQSLCLVTFSVMMPALVLSTACTMAVLRAYWAIARPGAHTSRATAPASATSETSFRIVLPFGNPAASGEDCRLQI
jgi:hypothetical protein